MSIEQTLERIAVGIEKLIEMQGGATTAANSPAISSVQAPVAPAPVGGPPVGGPPVGGPPQLAAVPTPMPGPSGTGPGQAMPPVAPMSPAAPAPAVDTGLLDQIRDAANTFHRAHPERAGEVWQVLSAVGAQKIDAIPAQSQAQVLQQLQALGA